ncbi:hypothetical protein BT96DRAFT_362750 [Gymnopus androsaceus JB14]|uniref:Uncharacterized protein n=1 Tax=Gymnopus androsaceus JB14 TaxID=1447944 RepID=A0A6A4GY27_9AGAR|nr:hypothetical protein BT96DRAFT_362750 [Gymnopus androsaceus JB14]
MLCSSCKRRHQSHDVDEEASSNKRVSNGTDARIRISAATCRTTLEPVAEMSLARSLIMVNEYRYEPDLEVLELPISLHVLLPVHSNSSSSLALSVLTVDHNDGGTTTILHNQFAQILLETMNLAPALETGVWVEAEAEGKEVSVVLSLLRLRWPRRRRRRPNSSPESLHIHTLRPLTSVISEIL